MFLSERNSDVCGYGYNTDVTDLIYRYVYGYYASNISDIPQDNAGPVGSTA